MFLWTKPWVFFSLRRKVKTVIYRKQTSHTAKVVLLQCCQSSYKEGRTVILTSNLVQTSLLVTQIRQGRTTVVTKGKGAYSRSKRKHWGRAASPVASIWIIFTIFSIIWNISPWKHLIFSNFEKPILLSVITVLQSWVLFKLWAIHHY